MAATSLLERQRATVRPLSIPIQRSPALIAGVPDSHTPQQHCASEHSVFRRQRLFGRTVSAVERVSPARCMWAPSSRNAKLPCRRRPAACRPAAAACSTTQGANCVLSCPTQALSPHPSCVGAPASRWRRSRCDSAPSRQWRRAAALPRLTGLLALTQGEPCHLLRRCCVRRALHAGWTVRPTSPPTTFRRALLPRWLWRVRMACRCRP